MTKEGRALLKEMIARAALDEFIMQSLKEEARKLDIEFMSAFNENLVPAPETHKVKRNCECCGREVNVPYAPGCKVVDLTTVICPFCNKPLRLNIPPPARIQ
jgi:hypothetical protein